MAKLSLVDTGKHLVKEVGEDDLSGFAAELAYRFFLALFPFFIFLAALGGLGAEVLAVDNPVEQVMDTLGDTLPSDASSVLQGQLEQVTENRDVGLMSIGFIGALWAASSGIGTIIKGMNRVHEVKETRPLPVRYGLAVGLTLLGGVFILALFILIVVGQVYGLRLAAEIGLEGVAATAITLLRYPVAVVLLMAAVAFLYWITPNIKLPFRWISPGAVVFALGWVTASFLFGLYVANFGSYNATYGALGGVVVLLIWFYLTGFILLLGAEINSVVAQEIAKQEVGTSETPAATQTEAALAQDQRVQRGVPPSVAADDRQPELRDRQATAKTARPAGRAIDERGPGYRDGNQQSRPTGSRPATPSHNGSQRTAADVPDTRDRGAAGQTRTGKVQAGLVGLITSVTLWRVISDAVSKRDRRS